MAIGVIPTERSRCDTHQGPPTGMVALRRLRAAQRQGWIASNTVAPADLTCSKEKSTTKAGARRVATEPRLVVVIRY